MSGRHRADWEDWEYRALFRACPPGAGPPSWAVLAQLAVEFDRTPTAFQAQWADARAVVRGSRSAASEAPVAYLERHLPKAAE
jgi:hypothetical protein